MSPFQKMKSLGFRYMGEYSHFDGWIFQEWMTLKGIKGFTLRIQGHVVFQPLTLPGSIYTNRSLWAF